MRTDICCLSPSRLLGEQGGGVNLALKRSLAALQHGGSSVPGLSSGSVSSGTSLSHHFPLVPFSRLPCPFPSLFLITHLELNKQLWAKPGCRQGGCADGKG